MGSFTHVSKFTYMQMYIFESLCAREWDIIDEHRFPLSVDSHG